MYRAKHTLPRADTTISIMPKRWSNLLIAVLVLACGRLIHDPVLAPSSASETATLSPATRPAPQSPQSGYAQKTYQVQADWIDTLIRQNAVAEIRQAATIQPAVDETITWVLHRAPQPMQLYQPTPAAADQTPVPAETTLVFSDDSTAGGVEAGASLFAFTGDSTAPIVQPARVDASPAAVGESPAISIGTGLHAPPADTAADPPPSSLGGGTLPPFGTPPVIEPPIDDSPGTVGLPSPATPSPEGGCALLPIALLRRPRRRFAPF